MTPRPASPLPKAARWHGVWDRLSLYLPVVLMGALAVITYGVVRQLPPPTAQGETPLSAGQPDYRLEHFTLRRYATDGTLETVLRGTMLEHVPAAQTLTVEQAQLERLSRKEGTRLHASAHTLQTDDDRTRYFLQGDVRVVREPWRDPVGTGAKRNATPRLTLEGQTLTWHTQQTAAGIRSTGARHTKHRARHRRPAGQPAALRRARRRGRAGRPGARHAGGAHWQQRSVAAAIVSAARATVGLRNWPSPPP
jgi:lipopolysaccharide export system protein LptC